MLLLVSTLIINTSINEHLRNECSVYDSCCTETHQYVRTSCQRPLCKKHWEVQVQGQIRKRIRNEGVHGKVILLHHQKPINQQANGIPQLRYRRIHQLLLRHCYLLILVLQYSSFVKR